MLPIAPLVHENLADTLHFVAVGPRDEVKGYESVLQHEEHIVGWYDNPAPADSQVIFTDRALLVSKGGSIWRLPYRHITSWRPNAESKSDITGIDVQCGNDWMKVDFVGRRGAEGETLDAFNFANVLSQVIRTPREQLAS